MRVEKLNDMVKGWFVGNFDPSLYKTNKCEVAVKSYIKGDFEKKHYHKIATEITVIVKGKVKMFNQVFSEGDMIVVEPGEATSFETLENCINVVVKLPGANNDKYECDNEN
jgi:quercetin dioxygenase-like cupin family protein|nr:hypothetical protein [uncultured Acetatifactor sp.]